MLTTWFAFSAINAEHSLANQWTTYINLLNNLSLYVAGLAIYYNTRSVNTSVALPMHMYICRYGIFIFYPASGDASTIVTGSTRLVFCIAGVLTVYGFYRNSIHLPPFISNQLTRLGLATLALRKSGYAMNPVFTLILVSLISIVVALATYRILEEPMIRLGKKLTSKQEPTCIASAPSDRTTLQRRQGTLKRKC
ncbi:hypothetical protein [Pseudomonas sp. SDI]|uniref:hypothetical protein n=1 Tax=Pseudomonas sp. SDI TaxID=2170734 RepID=UPI001057A159|nr:hypothetical protein [Pseudomonas sp. SDI]